MTKRDVSRFVSMKFGYFSVHDTPPWTTFSDVHLNTVEQYVACDELGFDSVWIAEYHLRVNYRI